MSVCSKFSQLRFCQVLFEFVYVITKIKGKLFLRHSVVLVLSVCMYVCLWYDNFWKPWCRKFVFAHAVYLQGNGIQVMFIYKGHRVKVTGAENVQNPYSCNVKLPSAITRVLQNIEPWCLCAAWGFWYGRAMADRMLWLPSLSHDRKLPCITKYMWSCHPYT